MDVAQLETLREPAVAAVRAHMAELRKQRTEALLPRLVAQRDAIEGFRDRRLAQLDQKEQAVLASGRKLRADERQRIDRARNEVFELVKARDLWHTQRVETDERAYVRIAGVLVGS